MVDPYEEKDNIDKVLDFLMEDSGRVYSPKEIAKKIDVNENTVRSSLSRLVFYKKIRRLRRGQYYYGSQPLDKNQKQLIS